MGVQGREGMETNVAAGSCSQIKCHWQLALPLLCTCSHTHTLAPTFYQHALSHSHSLHTHKQGKAQPQQLMRVGSTLYRRAMSFTVTSPKPLSVIRGIEEDGTAQLSALTHAGTSVEEVSGGLLLSTWGAASAHVFGCARV